jgi:hypothetical protein
VNRGQQVKCSELGELPWLDTPQLRLWLARWLSVHWADIYDDSLQQKFSEGRGAFGHAHQGMSRSMRGLYPRLKEMASASQLAAVHSSAKRHGLTTTRACVIDELRYFLKRHRADPEHSPAYRVSPWSNAHAMRDHFYYKRGGFDLPAEFYPNNADLRIWFELVIPHFTKKEITPAPSGPPQAPLFTSIRQFILNDRQHAPESLARFIVHAVDRHRGKSRQVVQEYLEIGGKRARSAKPASPQQAECFELVFSAIARRKRLREWLHRLMDADAEWLRRALKVLFIRVGQRAAPSIEHCLEDICVIAQPVLRDLRRNAPKNQVASAVERAAVEPNLTKFRQSRRLPPHRSGDSDKGDTFQVLRRRVRQKLHDQYHLD